MGFQKSKAKSIHNNLRLAITGASGSGKTYTALTVAFGIGAKNVCVLDTERDSALRYARYFPEFLHDNIMHFNPNNFISKMKDALDAGADCLIIDSLSHAWNGPGGILDIVNSKGGKFGAWKEATPLHQKLIDACMRFPGHIIVTMRSKQQYHVDERGTPQKVGLAPVQRDDVEYEFDIVLNMDHEKGKIEKTRCKELSGWVGLHPGDDFVQIVKEWIDPTLGRNGFDGSPKVEVDEVHHEPRKDPPRYDVNTPVLPGKVPPKFFIKAYEGALIGEDDNKSDMYRSSVIDKFITPHFSEMDEVYEPHEVAFLRVVYGVQKNLQAKKPNHVTPGAHRHKRNVERDQAIERTAEDRKAILDAIMDAAMDAADEGDPTPILEEAFGGQNSVWTNNREDYTDTPIDTLKAVLSSIKKS